MTIDASSPDPHLQPGTLVRSWRHLPQFTPLRVVAPEEHPGFRQGMRHSSAPRLSVPRLYLVPPGSLRRQNTPYFHPLTRFITASTISRIRKACLRVAKGLAVRNRGRRERSAGRRQRFSSQVDIEKLGPWKWTKIFAYKVGHVALWASHRHQSYVSLCKYAL